MENANTAGEGTEDKAKNRLLSFGEGQEARRIDDQGNGKRVMREVHHDQRNNDEAKK